jgi:hypothetical protein
MTKFFEGINDDTKYKIMRNEFVEMLRPLVISKDIDREIKNAISDSNGTSIFNPDNKRRQILGEAMTKYKFARKITQTLFEELDDKYFITPSILISDAGCQLQPIHRDFEPKEPRCKEGFFAIVAIENGTKLVVNDHGFHMITIVLNVGDILICRGDVIHAGAPYDVTNVRIHYYFDPKVRVDGKYLSLRSNTGTYALKESEELLFNFDDLVRVLAPENHSANFTCAEDQSVDDALVVDDQIIDQLSTESYADDTHQVFTPDPHIVVVPFCVDGILYSTPDAIAFFWRTADRRMFNGGHSTKRMSKRAKIGIENLKKVNERKKQRVDHDNENLVVF